MLRLQFRGYTETFTAVGSQDGSEVPAGSQLNRRWSSTGWESAVLIAPKGYSISVEVVVFFG